MNHPPQPNRSDRGGGRQPFSFLAGGRQWSPFDYLRPQRWNWQGLMRPLDAGLERQSAEPLSRLRLVGLRWFWLDGLLSTIGENFYVAFVPLFALAYGATKGQLGMLASVANALGMLAFMPGARAADRRVRRKPLVLWGGGGIARLMLLLLAASPFLGLDPGAMVAAIIALNGLRAFAGNFSNPAWTSIVADLVPPAIRGRYFAGRNVATALAALAVSPLAGQIVRILNRSGSHVGGYQSVFLIAFLVGVVATFTFSRIPEHGTRREERSRPRAVNIRRLLATNPVFGWYVGVAFVWTLALQIAGPFFNPFIVTDLGGDATAVGIAAGCFSLSTMLGQRFFGRLIDRRGSLAVLKGTGLIIPAVPVVWAVLQAPYQVYLAELVAGFVWAGYNLANFNVLLTLSPDRDRATATAIYQTAVFASAVIGPLAGGFLAEVIGYRACFLASGVGRMAATVLLIAVVRALPSTRAASS